MENNPLEPTPIKQIIQNPAIPTPMQEYYSRDEIKGVVRMKPVNGTKVRKLVNWEKSLRLN